MNNKLKEIKSFIRIYNEKIEFADKVNYIIKIEMIIYITI